MYFSKSIFVVWNQNIRESSIWTQNQLLTYVPLLYLLNILHHSSPDVANLFATMLRTGSKTAPSGLTYFQSDAFPFPIVVSKVAF